jgi:UDP-N-acetylglucosamine transferase subunit ALG13
MAEKMLTREEIRETIRRLDSEARLVIIHGGQKRIVDLLHRAKRAIRQLSGER